MSCGRGTCCQLRCVWWTILRALCVCLRQIYWTETSARSDMLFFCAEHKFSFLLTYVLYGECQQRTSENHVGYKPTTTTAAAAGMTSTSTAVGGGDRGGLIQCNSSGAPYDVVQIEQLTDTVSLPVPSLDTPRTRTRAAGILRHKETNF